MSQDALDHVWKPMSKEAKIQFAKEQEAEYVKKEASRLSKKYQETVEKQLRMAGLK